MLLLETTEVVAEGRRQLGWRFQARVFQLLAPGLILTRRTSVPYNLVL